MGGSELLHDAVKRADIPAIRHLLSAGHQPNALDAAGLPPIAYLLDHVDHVGFVLSDQIVEMIRMLRAAGAYPPSEKARRHVLDQASRNVTSALEANDAGRLADLLDFQPLGGQQTPEDRRDSGREPAQSEKPSPLAQSTMDPAIHAGGRVIMKPMAPARKILVGIFLIFLTLMCVALAVLAAQALAEGSESAAPLALPVVFLLFGAAFWFIRSSGRKTLRQLERIAAISGLTAIVDRGFGLTTRAIVEGDTVQGHLRATSFPAAAGGNPFTRIEIINAAGLDGLTGWIARDLAQHKLSCLGMFQMSGTPVYRVEISGVLGQSHVADFIIRLAAKMNDRRA